MHDQPGYDYHIDIPGTTLFDGAMAMKGYALNKMCYSFNRKECRDAFVADEEAYMAKFQLSDAQKQSVRERNIASSSTYWAIANSHQRTNAANPWWLPPGCAWTLWQSASLQMNEQP